jgi:hypothetical protein
MRKRRKSGGGGWLGAGSLPRCSTGRAVFVLTLGLSPAFAADTGNVVDHPIRLAQSTGNADAPQITLAPTLFAESSSRTILPIGTGAIDSLPKHSFVRLRGLPPAISLSDGYAIAPGAWAVPLSGLADLQMTVPQGVVGRSDVTVNLVAEDGALLAEAKTILVIRAPTAQTASSASAAPKQPSAVPPSPPAKETSSAPPAPLPPTSTEATPPPPKSATASSMTKEAEPTPEASPSLTAPPATPPPAAVAQAAPPPLPAPPPAAIAQATPPPSPTPPPAAIAQATPPPSTTATRQDNPPTSALPSQGNPYPPVLPSQTNANPPAQQPIPPRQATAAPPAPISPPPASARAERNGKQSAAKAPVLTPADRERAEKLIARGERETEQGNIAVARQFFLRAAEAGLPRGALLLAGTYDPRELSRMGVQGVQPNPAEARKWYMRARELGAPEAEERLARLPGG